MSLEDRAKRAANRSRAYNPDSLPIRITRHGKTVCPLCKVTAWWSVDRMREHMKEPHERCPYCSGSYVRLVNHLRAHPEHHEHRP